MACYVCGNNKYQQCSVYVCFNLEKKQLKMSNMINLWFENLKHSSDGCRHD